MSAALEPGLSLRVHAGAAPRFAAVAGGAAGEGRRLAAAQHSARGGRATGGPEADVSALQAVPGTIARLGFRADLAGSFHAHGPDDGSAPGCPRARPTLTHLC